MWLYILPSGEFQTYLGMLRCGNIVLMKIRFSDVAKFTTLLPLSLRTSHRISYLNVALKISSLPKFALKFSHKFSRGTSEINRTHAPVSCKSNLYTITYAAGACKFRTVVSHHQQLLLINSALLLAVVCPLCMKMPVLTWWLVFSFPKKNIK